MIDNENHISREDKIKKESSELKDDFCCYNCQQNKHILNNLVDVYYQADIDGTIKIISPSGVKMFGVEEAKQLIGQNVRDFYDNPKDRDEFFQDLLKKGNVRKKIILKDIAGNKRIFEANSTVIFDRTHKPIATEGILRDVTEEEIIKKELHNAKEQHKILADNIIDSIWLIDLNGNFFYCSPSAQSMLGYEIKELEKIKLKKILTPISYTHVQKRVAGLIQQYKLENNPKIFEQSRYMQLTAVKKNGEQLPVEITARIIVKDNGELHIVGSTRDISERIATEKRLFKSEEQFQQTFVNASVGMIIVDKNGSIINANQAFLKMLDYDQNDIKKTSMADFVLPASYNENILQELLNNDNSKTFQRRVRRNDGKILWTIIDVSPIKDEENNILFFISQIQDITTIIETQIELLKFKKITDKANYGVVMTDLDGKIIYTNEAFMTMHGYNKSSDVIGTEYINYCKNEQQECFENIKQALDEEGWHETKEMWHKKNSGKIFPVLSSGQMIRNNNDKFQFVAFTVIDITDKKKVEEKIMEAQKMDSIGSLTMGIAHDFNNMLGGVSGYASILLDEIVDNKQREYLEKIVEITEKANQLTKKLLSFGKADQSNKCEMDINQSVNEVLLIIKYRIKQNIAIKTEYTDNIDQIEAEPIEINQIIMNLCANGLDAMPNGGILKITTSNFTQKKHDNSLEAGNYVAVAVSDNGCGMSDDLIRKIFEPFFTTKKTNKHSGGGLGLTTSLAIARKMGGNIVVESKIGHGSKFTLFLPAKQIDKQPEDNLLITNKVTKTILLVDNEPTILHMAAIMLNNLGYQAMLASGGREATEKYAMNHANIIGVILDWQMPDMCGAQIIDNIMEINSQAKIIISSGMNEEIVQKEYLPDKVAGLLTKPYNVEQMRQILNKLQQQ